MIFVEILSGILFLFTVGYISTLIIRIKYYTMKRVYKLENKKYSHFNLFHYFMKTNKCIDGKIPLANINTKAKIKKSLSIGICVRNCEKYLYANLQKIDEICNLFESSNIIFYENGSNDNSLKLLKRYCNENKHVILINEKYPTFLFPRTVRLARARNICLNIANIIKNDIYIVLDFDNVITGLKVDSIEKCFTETFEWGALFANQENTYYDLWALRTYDNWMNYDCWEATSIVGNKVAFNQKGKNIPKNSKIKVISAFGGLGIYNLSKLDHCYYYGWKNNRESCEHVHFHKQVNKNSDLFIIGYLINH